MKASELIVELAKSIAAEGDCEVIKVCGDKELPIKRIVRAAKPKQVWPLRL